jgi:C4-dicarboxylate-specific signal transduction histidine kinase
MLLRLPACDEVGSSRNLPGLLLSGKPVAMNAPRHLDMPVQAPSTRSENTAESARLVSLESERAASLINSRNWVLLLPSFVLATFVVAILALLWVLYWHDREVERAQVQRDLTWTNESIRRGLAADQEFIERLAEAVGDNGEVTAATANDANDAVAESYSLLNVTWNSPRGEAMWMVASGRIQAQAIAQRPTTLELARVMRLVEAMGRSTYTHTYQDFDGTSYIEYHSPIIRKGQFLGTLSATFSLAGILEAYVPSQYAEKYQFAFIDASARELFVQRPRATLSGLFTESVLLTLPWRELRLQAKSYRSETPIARDALAIVTVLLLIILTWALWLLQRYINRRVESDAQMQESYDRFLTVFDALDAAVYVADLDDQHVLFMNEACRQRFPEGRMGDAVHRVEQVFSAQPTQIIPIGDLIGPEGPNPLGTKGEFEDRLTGRWYLVRAKVIRWVDGRLVRMHMASDITDRKIAEESSRTQKERLMQTARLMTAGEMASTLAHEINQPLAAIANYNMGCVRRLRSGQWQEADLLAAMEKAAQQAERAGRVVSRMREFVRTREPNRLAQDINDIILDVVRLSGLDGEAANVSLELDLAAKLPPVLADQIMVEQVILNLVKNGNEAMADLPMGQRRMRIRTHLDADGNVEIAIRDVGHGVDPAVEDELFSPFFTTKRNGMGIGLNICRSIIELHEGRLWYTRNEAASGSTFRFTLPVVE